MVNGAKLPKSTTLYVFQLPLYTRASEPLYFVQHICLVICQIVCIQGRRYRRISRIYDTGIQGHGGSPTCLCKGPISKEQIGRQTEKTFFLCPTKASTICIVLVFI